MSHPNQSSHHASVCGSGGDATSPSAGQSAHDSPIAASLSRIRHKLIVMSGKGGVGKSSVSAGLAICLAALGRRVGLMDVDIHGPSLAGIMGVRGLLEVSGDGRAAPKQVNDHLKIVSMQSLIQDADQAVIWRGPAKTGLIRQFVGEVEWGPLDFLIIDAPPGTGDEPLSVAQTIPEAQAVIVTTPQEVALMDVRKSISFCRAVNLRIAGLVENMGPFECPCCGKTISLFKSDGGRMTAEKADIPFLGTLPFEPQVVKICDAGLPGLLQKDAPAFTAAMERIIASLLQRIEQT